MKTFLDIVVEDLLTKSQGDLSRYTIVFPNKRASLFFNHSLAEQTTRPVWSPRYTTISELLGSLSGLMAGDRIQLVFELYRSYVTVTGSTETLDQFYSWGELMLSDFDDIDKHMAEAGQVLQVVADLHELDTTDFLNEDQIRVLKQFFSNFTEKHNSELRQRFLQLWSKFKDIYSNYHERFGKLGIAYEGMLYRDAIETLRKDGGEALTKDGTIYVFVGFNLLNKVEESLFDYLKGEGRARFYWDFDDYYMHGSEAGRYIAGHLKNYPNELPLDHEIYRMFEQKRQRTKNRDHGRKEQADVTFLAAPTEDLQARYVSQWLTPERILAGRKTAIVMADESLLETVLYCLPPEVTHVNITTGYPLAQSHIASFVRLYMVLLQKRNHTLHNVNALLRHPYAKNVSEKAGELLEYLNDNKIYYPTDNDLNRDENLTRLFAPLSDVEDYMAINDRLLWAVKTIAMNGSMKEGEAEGLYRMHKVLNRLSSLMGEGLPLPSGNGGITGMALYRKLLQQIVQSTTIPFHGEPVEGIQIMGVLETRNLDFEHVLLLSCNEGNMPAKVSDSSFIPHSIRKAHDLTTIDNKVAIYSYYFHRLLQRCPDVTVTYNNSTANGQTGEMSRFMLQLLAESNIMIGRGVMTAGQTANMTREDDVEKTPEMVKHLLDRGKLSPSGLDKYLRCPKRFYYCYVMGIREDDSNDTEEMDAQTFGTIFHKSAELIYKGMEGRMVTREYIRGLLEEKGNITLNRIVDQAFREELFNIKDKERKTPRLGGLQVINREMVMKFLKGMLNYDLDHAPFTMLHVEHYVEEELTVSSIFGENTVKIIGTIDRLDQVTENGVTYTRVIDYKTGKYSELNMRDIEAIFDPSQTKNHSGYYLQALLYSCIKSSEYQNVVPMLLYVSKLSAGRSSTGNKGNYSPLLSLNRLNITDVAPLKEEFMAGVKKLIEEILNPELPFKANRRSQNCDYCIYKMLCE